MPDPNLVELTDNHPVMWKFHARAHHAEACLLMLNADKNIKGVYEQLKRAEEKERIKIMFGSPFTFAGGAHLLLGLAIEVALKGIWICRNGHERVPAFWRTDGHNLLKLADSVGVDLPRPERKQLEYYKDHIVWVSKYPASFKPTKSHTWHESFMIRDGAGLVIYKKCWKLLCEEYDKWALLHPDKVIKGFDAV